jgi:2-dehydro-3-deoxygalactonokinase
VAASWTVALSWCAVAEQATLFCVDMGTTRTRAWLTTGAQVRAHLVRDFGVRDAAEGLDLQSALIDLLAETAVLAGVSGHEKASRKVAAAGMISSPQGLVEVPHLAAPAGADTLAAGVRRIALGPSEQYELLLVPGVRTGNGAKTIAETLDSDIMRGEETLCVGLLSLGFLGPGDAVLNLGSHWKWIWVDTDARIASSRTAMTGEMIHAIQSHTLLASAVPQRPPAAFEKEWLALGAAEAGRSGLSRALFCVRLLQQAKHGNGDEQLAFFYGAFLEAETQALQKADALRGLPSVCIVGTPALAGAWKARLEQEGLKAHVLEEVRRDAAYLAGLRRITSAAVES